MPAQNKLHCLKTSLDGTASSLLMLTIMLTSSTKYRRGLKKKLISGLVVQQVLLQSTDISKTK